VAPTLVAVAGQAAVAPAAVAPTGAVPESEAPVSITTAAKAPAALHPAPVVAIALEAVVAQVWVILCLCLLHPQAVAVVMPLVQVHLQAAVSLTAVAPTAVAPVAVAPAAVAPVAVAPAAVAPAKAVPESEDPAAVTTAAEAPAAVVRVRMVLWCCLTHLQAAVWAPAPVALVLTLTVYVRKSHHPQAQKLVFLYLKAVPAAVVPTG